MDTVFEYISSLQGCTTLPNALDHSGRTHFPGSCPASEDQHVAALPRLSREVPAGLHPKHSGDWAHRPLYSRSLHAGRSRPPPLGHRPGHAAMLNWTSDKASADTATSRPITILTWWLVHKGQRPTQNKYPNHSVLLACGDE